MIFTLKTDGGGIKCTHNTRCTGPRSDTPEPVTYPYIAPCWQCAEDRKMIDWLVAPWEYTWSVE